MMNAARSACRTLAGSLLVLLAFLTVGGCSSTGSGLITSFDDLTSESERQGTTDINQNRIISISGSLPHTMPGTIYRYKKSRAASTAFGISTGNSYVLSKTIEAPSDAKELLSSIRDSILEARLAAAKLAALRLQQIQLESGLESDDDDSDRAILKSQANLLAPQVTKARDDLSTRVNIANKLINESGLLVFRWSTQERSDVSLQTLFGLRSRRESASSGYAIVAGLRESTLFVGKDIGKLFDSTLDLRERFHWDLGLRWNWFPWFFYYGEDENLRITTKTIQVQHIAYFKDLDIATAVAASVDTTIEQLANHGKLVEQLQEIEIDLAFASSAILSNEARLAEAKWSQTNSAELLKEVNEPVKSLALKDSEEFRQPGDWQTIFVVDTDLKALKNLFK